MPRPCPHPCPENCTSPVTSACAGAAVGTVVAPRTPTPSTAAAAARPSRLRRSVPTSDSHGGGAVAAPAGDEGLVRGVAEPGDGVGVGPAERVAQVEDAGAEDPERVAPRTGPVAGHHPVGPVAEQHVAVRQRTEVAVRVVEGALLEDGHGVVAVAVPVPDGRLRVDVAVGELAVGHAGGVAVLEVEDARTPDAHGVAAVAV